MLALSVGVLFEMNRGNLLTLDANEWIEICLMDYFLDRTIVMIVTMN